MNRKHIVELLKVAVAADIDKTPNSSGLTP